MAWYAVLHGIHSSGAQSGYPDSHVQAHPECLMIWVVLAKLCTVPEHVLEKGLRGRLTQCLSLGVGNKHTSALAYPDDCGAMQV